MSEEDKTDPTALVPESESSDDRGPEQSAETLQTGEETNKDLMGDETQDEVIHLPPDSELIQEEMEEGHPGEGEMDQQILMTSEEYEGQVLEGEVMEGEEGIELDIGESQKVVLVQDEGTGEYTAYVGEEGPDGTMILGYDSEGVPIFAESEGGDTEGIHYVTVEEGEVMEEEGLLQDIGGEEVIESSSDPLQQHQLGSMEEEEEDVGIGEVVSGLPGSEVELTLQGTEVRTGRERGDEEEDVEIGSLVADEEEIQEFIEETVEVEAEVEPEAPFMEITTRRRFSQEREGNCYCGKDRNLNIVELLCASCSRWYHESCIGYQLGKLVPFNMNYVFICKNCSPSGLESFKRNQAQFSQMLVTAIANLTQVEMKEGRSRRMFSKDKDIIPFFDIHWDAMTTTTRRVTSAWHSTLSRALQKEVGVLFSMDDDPSDPDAPYFGLISSDLTEIKPNYEAMISGGQLKVAELQSSAAALKSRGAKRRTVGGEVPMLSQASIAKKTKGETLFGKPMFGHGYPSDHPFNKEGYRYVLAEPDPNAPFRQEFDESSDWAKTIPGWLYRVLISPSVMLALHDRAQQLKVSEDRYSVTGEKGYCMIRASHEVSKGSWYWEAKITELPEGSATRIGWCQQHANLQAPLGFDKFGYSWRSIYGTKFHEAKGYHYGEPYTLGDVLGFLLILPSEITKDRTVDRIPPSLKDKPLVRFKSHLYYEEKDISNEIELKETDRIKGSQMYFFKNGVCQGLAFENIYDGAYTPAVSLYKNCTVSVNFGPKFEFPPKDFYYRAMNDRGEDAIIEQTVADLLFLTENDGKLLLDNTNSSTNNNNHTSVPATAT